MGRVTRWFKSLFGTKKINKSQSSISGDVSEKRCGGSGDCNLPRDTVKLRTLLTDIDKEQNEHAIAVAAATASAAEVAVLAANAAAAAAVVRLSGKGRAGDIITREEHWAAVKIQKVFRGSLARKALRALKSIVKVQALVRGYLVRKQTASMLQTLIRVQTAMRSRRLNSCLNEAKDNFNEAAKRSSSRSRSRSRQVHNVVVLSEYGDDVMYKESDLEWKFATAQNTPRLSSSLKQHQANKGYYHEMQSPAKSVCVNVLCEDGMSSPGYMEKTQSFKAKVRSNSAPRQRSERMRLPLDVGMSRSSMSLEQQQRYSSS